MNTCVLFILATQWPNRFSGRSGPILNVVVSINGRSSVVLSDPKLPPVFVPPVTHHCVSLWIFIAAASLLLFISLILSISQRSSEKEYLEMKIDNAF